MSKKWGVTVLLSACLGLFGADRFYLGQVRWGIWKLLTIGGLGLWWLSDLVLWLGIGKQFASVREHATVLNKYNITIAAVVSSILGILLIFLVMQLPFKSFEVFQRGEMPTFIEGDLIVVNKLSYVFGSPSQLEYIVFYSPGSNQRDRLDPFLTNHPRFMIKRIVAVPGDTVEVKNNSVYRNGFALNEPYVNEKPSYYMPERVIPDGMYFVLGDNRNHSNDSHTGWLVPRNDIFGKVWFRYWSGDYPDIRVFLLPLFFIILVSVFIISTVNLVKSVKLIKRTY